MQSYNSGMCCLFLRHDMIVVQVKFSVVTIDDVDVTLMIWQCPCLYDNENMIHDVLPMM